MHAAHFREVYDCGHVGGQCRCPGPKTERRIPGPCTACRAKTAMALMPLSPLPTGSATAPLGNPSLHFDVHLDEMPVYYDEGPRPAGLRFRTVDGTLLELRLSMDEYERLLERQNKVIGTMRDDALK
jgi:hypothetical protein